LNRWLTVKSTSLSALVLSVELRSDDGRSADQIDDLVDQLGDLILGYATSDNPDLDAIMNARYRFPKINGTLLERVSVERLTSPENDYKTLKGFTGESLSHWFYTTFHNPLAVSTPKAHSSDPAFDLIALMEKGCAVRVACVQAKTSAGNGATLASAAVTKYKSLQSGRFEFELASELRLLARMPAMREKLNGRPWRDVLLDESLRDHVLVIAYDGTAPLGPASEWPGRWAEIVPGIADRRLLITFPLLSCNAFIQRLAEEIRAKAY